MSGSAPASTSLLLRLRVPSPFLFLLLLGCALGARLSGGSQSDNGGSDKPESESESSFPAQSPRTVVMLRVNTYHFNSLRKKLQVSSFSDSTSAHARTTSSFPSIVTANKSVWRNLDFVNVPSQAIILGQERNASRQAEGDMNSR